MIISRLMGGMGNQMFQYAIGRNLAIKHQTELKLDLSFLLDRTPRKNFVFRNFDLDLFNIDTNIASPEEIIDYNRFSGSRSKNILSTIAYKIRGSRYNVIEEKKIFTFDPAVLATPDNSYLIGYWQCIGYFNEISDTIKKDFTIKKQLSGKVAEMLAQITNVNSICVNVRRTDYITAGYGVCGVDYYQRAVAFISDKVDFPNIFVFSDDIEWCKNNLKFDLPTTFVGPDYAGERYGDYLQLMINCSHFIIPNSTFGWWAAWLSYSQNKIIVAPKNWAEGENFYADDLLPDEWIKI